MGPLDAVDHLLNLFVMPLLLGALAAALAKLVWRRELATVAWRRLAGWASLASGAAAVAGLVVSGHDGRMATYGAMVLVCALALWWTGFGRRR